MESTPKPNLAPMKSPYHRPRRLSDPYCDHGKQRCAELLAVPDQQLVWRHYQAILGPFLPAGTYEESLYFLPLAFRYILCHDEEALDLVTSLVWFASEYASQLRQDGLLSAARANLLACLKHWTARFRVVHYDREACRRTGWRSFEYRDLVKDSELVTGTTGDLVRFGVHEDIAHDFVRSLAEHGGDPVGAAWFLEYARARFDAGYRPPNAPAIQGLLKDAGRLRSAAEVVLQMLFDVEPSPTYWNDTFTMLGL